MVLGDKAYPRHESHITKLTRLLVNQDSKSVIGHISGGLDLEMDEMAEVVGSIMEGNWSDDEIALLLNALRLKGETVAEVAGAAQAMRRHMTPVRTDRKSVV